MARPWKPTPQQLAAARGKTVRDVIAPYLKVLFCGINPGLYSGAVGHHFARPGNRFWPALFAAGFTDRLLSPFEERMLLQYGYGITNVVTRSTANASELSAEELRQGARRLEKKARRYRPHFIAFVGIVAYRVAFAQKHARLGRQREKLASSAIWVLPNPSGLNAHFTPKEFAKLFRKLRLAIDAEPEA